MTTNNNTDSKQDEVPGPIDEMEIPPRVIIHGIEYMRSRASIPAVEGDARALFKNACRLHTSWMIDRYLMSNACNRPDPAEKAERHIELCRFYVAAVRGCSIEDAMSDYEQDFDHLHEESQELTSSLNTKIGFPLDQTPDYADLNPKFFERFHAIACRVLGVSPAAASSPAPAEPAQPWLDEGGHAWEIKQNVTCVECPHCCFTFAAVHTDGNSDGYSCPNCEGCPDAAPAQPEGEQDRADAQNNADDLVAQLVAIDGPCQCSSALCKHWQAEAGIILTAAVCRAAAPPDTPVVARELYSELIHIAAELVKGEGFLSPCAEDHSARTPRGVIAAAQYQDNALKDWANRIRQVANKLSAATTSPSETAVGGEARIERLSAQLKGIMNTLAISQQEVERLRAGNFTPEEFQNLCHNFDESDKEAFIAGCLEYQKKLFGTVAPVSPAGDDEGEN